MIWPLRETKLITGVPVPFNPQTQRQQRDRRVAMVLNRNKSFIAWRSAPNGRAFRKWANEVLVFHQLKSEFFEIGSDI